MDFSQLPKMSKTPPVTDTSSPSEPLIADAVEPIALDEGPSAVPIAHAYGPVQTSAVGFASVWISFIAGVILLALGQTFGRYLAARLGGHDFATNVNWTAGPNAGQPVGYFDLEGGTAWADAGLFLMGIALLLDAALLTYGAMRRPAGRPLLFAALALTAVAMLINVGVVVHLFALGITPMTSLIALLVGGFVLFDHMPMRKQA